MKDHTAAPLEVLTWGIAIVVKNLKDRVAWLILMVCCPKLHKGIYVTTSESSCVM